MNTISTEHQPTDEFNSDWLEMVRQKAKNLRFGSIQITVHEGRVTQIESIEKTRFPATKSDSPHLK
jgi:hypothetical protein